MQQTSSGLWVPPSTSIQNKKADPPKLGEAFGRGWTGNFAGQSILTLPGGGTIAFDLSRLTLTDFRGMRDHYQINASLSVLSFMLHQIEWEIEHPDKQVAEMLTEQMRNIWTRLVRAKSHSFWAGYSPNVLQWENDTNSRQVVLTKIKDLIPENCQVNWKEIPGWAPTASSARPMFKVYDGIKERGSAWPVPVDNSYWYPLLMENGDYYGRKLLRPAFTSWFFSTLVHLFANRYYERFGEPTPVGRAPYEEEIQVNGEMVRGNVLMENVISALRNRSVVVLPNEQSGDGANAKYDYTLEYLESQMRGADFERYMTRLDEEMSLALFMPLLLLRTADVGSYNLGVTHFQLWLWVMNALTGDWKEYINRYILSPMVNYNVSPNAPRASIKFTKLGKIDAETLRALITGVITAGKGMPDLDELGQLAGLTIKEVRQVTKPPPPANDPNQPNDPNAPPPADPKAPPGKKNLGQPKATLSEISSRVKQQVIKAFRENKFGHGFTPDMGHRRRFEESLHTEGFDNPRELTDTFYGNLNAWLKDVCSLGRDEFSTPESFMGLFDRACEIELESIAG